MTKTTKIRRRVEAFRKTINGPFPPVRSLSPCGLCGHKWEGKITYCPKCTGKEEK